MKQILLPVAKRIGFNKLEILLSNIAFITPPFDIYKVLYMSVVDLFSSTAMNFIFFLILSLCEASKSNDRGLGLTLGYFPKIDGIKCSKAEWDELAVKQPILESRQGKIKGTHRCKLNRRYAPPEANGDLGPRHFEGDVWYNVPYAKHVRRFDYGQGLIKAVVDFSRKIYIS